MKIKAVLKHSRIAPRKVRLVADLIRRQPVDKALASLKFTTKRGAKIMEQVLRSAIANAAQNPNVGSVDDLYVSEILVDGGPSLKRFRPATMGRAHRIRKYTSHITVVLDEATVKGGSELGAEG